MRDEPKGAGWRSRWLRKQVVEPVFRQIKQARGFRQLPLRGFDKVTARCALTRRTLCSGAAVWPIRTLLASAHGLRPLKDIARERGILFGSAIDYPDAAVLHNPEASALYERECAVF